MDLVYIVGEDTVHNYVELRYSLRSMFKYLSRIDQVFIVGTCPAFLRDVIYIPAEDNYRYNSGRNIYEKMAKACLDPRLSSHFWCAADDHFLLAPLSQKGYPYFYLGSMWETIGKLSKESKFKPYIEATFWALYERGLPTKNFNSHLPMIFQKNIFIELLDSFDWDLSKSYTVKGLYPNVLKIPGVKIGDSKIQTPKTKTAIYRHLKKTFFFSTNEDSINPEMLEVFGELYTNPSPVEIPDPDLSGSIIRIQDLKKLG